MLRFPLILAVAVLSQLTSAQFAPRMFARTGRLMPYRLFVPPANRQSEKLPLVVWLHGASGVGTDNHSQIS
jgi:predicted peptidase